MATVESEPRVDELNMANSIINHGRYVEIVATRVEDGSVKKRRYFFDPHEVAHFHDSSGSATLITLKSGAMHSVNVGVELVKEAFI